MKILSLVVLLTFSCSVWAQKPIFVRVYDMAGKKINKGRVLAFTDTSLQLKGKITSDNIPVKSIGIIKTKRSAGNNVLVSSIIGLSTLTILGVASSDSDQGFFNYTAGEGAVIGAISGLTYGAAIGGLTILFKSNKSYLINGNVTRWKEFQLKVAEK